jgi:hypothetical protein
MTTDNDERQGPLARDQTKGNHTTIYVRMRRVTEEQDQQPKTRQNAEIIDSIVHAALVWFCNCFPHAGACAALLCRPRLVYFCKFIHNS